MPCEKCFYMDEGKKIYHECYCEADKKQVEEDDKRAAADGFRCINGRWKKPKRSTSKK